MTLATHGIMTELTNLSKTMLLRKATQADAEEITNVYLVSRKKLPYAPLAHSDVEILHWIKETLIPTNQVTVVENNSIIIGMMALSKTQDIGWIDQLYLLPESTGLGIGTMLLNFAKNTLGSPMRLHTFQENIQARRFYERHGFCIIALSDGSNNEERCPDMLYEWREDKAPR